MGRGNLIFLAAPPPKLYFAPAYNTVTPPKLYFARSIPPATQAIGELTCRRNDWHPVCVLWWLNWLNAQLKVTSLSDRRQILLNKRLLCNCTNGKNCRSRSDYQRFNKRHHTSICDAVHPNDDVKSTTSIRGVAFTTNQVGEGLFLVIIVEDNGMGKCRELIDSGAGSSCVGKGDRSSQLGKLPTSFLRPLPG